MNHKWGIPSPVLVAAAPVTFRISHHALCRPLERGLDHLQDDSFLALKLSPSHAQLAKLKRLHATPGEGAKYRCIRRCVLSRRLGQAVAAETNSRMRVKAPLKEVCPAYEQNERSTLNRILAMRAVSNPDQKRRFYAMIRHCMYEPCSMHSRSSPERRDICMFVVRPPKDFGRKVHGEESNVRAVVGIRGDSVIITCTSPCEGRAVGDPRSAGHRGGCH